MREQVIQLVKRAKVLANTFVTYAVLASSVLSGAAATLQASDVPGAAKAGVWAVTAVGYLASVVKVVRRVTQVPDDLVGLLLPEGQRPVVGIFRAGDADS